MDVVYGYGGPPLPGGDIDFGILGQYVLYTGVDPTDLGSFEGQAYLLSGTLLDLTKSTTLIGPPFPGGDIDFTTPLQFGWAGGLSTIWPAATIGRSSAPGDTPSNTYVPAKLEPVFPYRVELFSGADPTKAGANTIGIMQIDDPDGELDGLLSLNWDGAALSILRGDPATRFRTWSVVATVTAAGMLYSRLIKEIQLRDLAWLLNAAPLHDQRYGGTGGVDGDLSLAGVIKPYAVGNFFNASPTLIVAMLLCYQVSCSSVRSLTVKDGMNPLVNDGDVATYAALAAATIAPGHYLTCLAQGLFRLGGAPALAITVDGTGDNDTLNGHGFPSTRGQIARRIVTGRGRVVLDDVSGLDNASFSALDVKQPAACGWFWNQETTKAAALDTIMSGCLGFWFMRLNGTLAVGQCEDPATLTPYLSLSFPAPGVGEVRVGEPSMTDYKTPRRQTFVGYQKNFTPLQVNQIAGVILVDLTTSSIAQAPTQYAISTDNWANNSFPTGPVVTVDGAFATLAPAQAETDRQQALMRVRRERYSLLAAVDPFGDFVGRIVQIQNFNRLGWGASKNFLCVGMEVRAGSMTILELWG